MNNTMGVRIVFTLGLLFAPVLDVKAQDAGCAVGETGDALADAMAEAQCKGSAARKKSLRLEKEAVELRRAAEEKMERLNREAAELQEAIELAKHSEVRVPATVRALPRDGNREARLIATIARAACNLDPHDYSPELNALDWGAFRNVKDLAPYMAGMSPCEARKFLNIVEQSRKIQIDISKL